MSQHAAMPPDPGSAPRARSTPKPAAVDPALHPAIPQSPGAQAVRRWTLPLVAALSVAGSGILAAVTDGNIGATLAPPLLVIGLWAIVRAPMRYTLGVMFWVVILFHNPSSRPHEGRWSGILKMPSALIFKNLHEIVGVDALRFNGIEAMLFLILLVLLIRKVTGDPVDGPPPPMAAPINSALKVSLIAILVWCAYGVVRGGDSRQMLWQVREIVWLPVIGMLFARYLGGPKARRFFVFSALIMATLRALEGIWFWYTVAIPMNYYKMEYITTHEDSVLYGSLLVLFATSFWELEKRPRSKLLYLALLIIIYGMILNTRRLAYVSITLSMLMVFTTLRAPVKRTILKVALVLAPVLTLYVVGAQFSKSAIFRPIHSLTSVTDESNSSNKSRDDENMNLVWTMKPNPLFGSGFGHPYNEVIRSFDISGAMSNYRYLAHNSVLWLWSLMGLVGISLAWMYLPILVLLARRAYANARNGPDRVAALSGITMVIMYVVQAYGDMGVLSWMIVMLMAATISSISSLAVETGAWPPMRRA